MRSPGQVLAEWFVRELTRSRREYRRYVFNDERRLKSRIRPGDVVLVDGVVSPLVKYIDFNIRICRPAGLTHERIETVVDYVLSRVGFTYDRRIVFDLFRYLLPLQLLPMRLREDALHFGSRREAETICSSLLAEAFDRVAHPILRMHIRRK